jgi:hypothetical protein
MAMNKFLHHALMAYRPLYLNGLLLEGRCRLPASRVAHEPAPPSVRPRKRALLVALGGLGACLGSRRDTPC